MLTINTNVASLNSQRNLSGSQSALSTSLQRLSSGLRINSAKDDAAGLAISERMTSQIKGLDQAKRNANDGISLSQTAEGALGQVGDMLQRMRELAVQSANASNSASDRAALQKEVGQLKEELDRVATTTQFNGLNILDGSFKSQNFQVGANANQTIGMSLNGARLSQIGAYAHATGDANANTVAATESGSLAAVTVNNASYAGVTSAGSTGSNIQFNVDGQTVNVKSSAQFVGADTVAQTADSAYAVAAAINGSGLQGISAKAETSVQFDAVGTDALVQFTAEAGANPTPSTYALNINGTAIELASSTTLSGDISMDTAVTKINEQSEKTGVVASYDTTANKLTLTAKDGRNIVVNEVRAQGNGDTTDAQIDTAFTTAAAAADGTKDSTLTYRGQVTLEGQSDIELVTGADVLGLAAAAAPNFKIAASGDLLDLSVASVDDANSAILKIDSALKSINDSRADLGALQNRFSSTITSLQTNSENLNASRSRIRDADFASETATLSRNQILQQAGTAMLAQANQLPQQVLSLLR